MFLIVIDLLKHIKICKNHHKRQELLQICKNIEKVLFFMLCLCYNGKKRGGIYEKYNFKYKITSPSSLEHLGLYRV